MGAKASAGAARVWARWQGFSLGVLFCAQLLLGCPAMDHIHLPKAPCPTLCSPQVLQDLGTYHVYLIFPHCGACCVLLSSHPCGSMDHGVALPLGRVVCSINPCAEGGATAKIKLSSAVGRRKPLSACRSQRARGLSSGRLSLGKATFLPSSRSPCFLSEQELCHSVSLIS